jgi:hypothetical protein
VTPTALVVRITPFRHEMRPISQWPTTTATMLAARRRSTTRSREAGVLAASASIRNVPTARYCDTRRVSSSSDPTLSGPWPEPDEIEPRERPGSLVERGGDGSNGAGGSKGVAIVVAGLNLGLLLALPALIVLGVYTFITVYAIVKAFGGGADTADPATVLIGVVGLVTLFTTLLGVGVWAIGRTADPKKRRFR